LSCKDNAIVAKLVLCYIKSIGFYLGPSRRHKGKRAFLSCAWCRVIRYYIIWSRQYGVKWPRLCIFLWVTFFCKF